MRGIVWTGDDTFVTDKLAVRAPSAGEVRVKLMAAGLCHSDVSVMQGAIPWSAPAVIGHEGAGIVIEVGANVSTVGVGEHVIISTLAFCGSCRRCLSGCPWLCPRSIGNRTEPFTFDGAPCSNFAASSCFAEETVISERQAVRIPKDVPFTSAALVGCGVITGVGAVWNRTDVQPGDTAAVFGTGGVGLNVIQALRLKRAGRIIAIDTNAGKEALARQFGASDFIDASNCSDVVATLRALVPDPFGLPSTMFNAGGVDWSFDVVAHPTVTRNAFESLGWGGTCVVIGVPPPGTETSQLYSRFTHMDRTLTGTRAGSYVPQRDFPVLIDLYRSGELLLDELVTKTYPLTSFRDAVHDLEAGILARGVLTFE
jgi:Zn-dependent alcohol dehydrogenase